MYGREFAPFHFRRPYRNLQRGEHAEVLKWEPFAFFFFLYEVAELCKVEVREWSAIAVLVIEVQNLVASNTARSKKQKKINDNTRDKNLRSDDGFSEIGAKDDVLDPFFVNIH